MKIAIVCYPTFGGSGVVATELGIALSKRGHEIHFITYKQPVRLELLSSNVHFHEVNVPEYPLFHYQPYELALSSKLVNVIRNHRIDLLHVHYAIPHAYAGYMAKKMLQSEGITIPMVTTLHGTDITLVGNHPFYKPAVTFSINNSDVITCVSESLKQDTLRHFEVTKDIDVVHNFIDTNVSEKVFTDCQRDLMAEADEKIITHISNLRPVKRLNDVVSVFYKIQQSIKAKLIIVGEGPEREAAEQLIKEYDIANNVIFVGQSNEIDKILCFSDLFLLPSEAESFGLAALEAMVDGVPVISSNAGGLPEVNIHGESGFLSDVGDIDDMAANALKIFKDEKTLKEFKERAKKVAKSFDINTIVPKYESLYQKAIDNIFA
ncbi:MULTISPECIES: N-acetyl-alpha-D-glucosaminyl L-malate synthase BshA [Croceibacter]|jgi:N-acetyl-alpha-D-glucosaminyl L-malate synthase BshA|uniref:Glycosyltransferase n=1 Tax=Croceibacter atlanticus (strain ATCC BAA-628 / JCM 21780 / CIP 108009 / IAM 15332 / KCTC 12090 / HTCC2559) TaxID=216432 RepID=A3U9T1_CROAH|nr:MULTISPECIES: N-acetyl-alpha-D-glucosaminyl L-malate synthase BshA [Croceibacter]EAP86567.1 glycosyltransferase [Croceibacter atlanticus HTCC2559]MBG26257.1 N-acetyl-alpha-D-glucosaminyl L-malate synthase BshA [Croceibacter sp.]MBW4970960.1 N-acetyl-alpha-D-glucosaminyl L-malate synthase BshA [Croceibacter atlanticus]|tara:strand:+ start:5043 stop:6176 length:1134 start_codon:yes stop_codon:yes gene_type:complete